MSESLRLLSWNVGEGGFASYVPDDQRLEANDAVRGEAIADLVDTQHQFGANAVSLVDTYRWDEVYGGEYDIARHLGFQAARFVRLEDKQLMADYGAGIGITFATDLPIASSEPIDMGTRQGLNVTLDVGKQGLQVATVYLNHFDQAIREEQVKALLSQLRKDIPTIITGDFNMLRPRIHGPVLRIKDAVIRSAGKVATGEQKHTIDELNKRSGITLFEEAGFQDADAVKTRPTWPSQFPIVGVDYLFHNSQVAVTSFRTLSANGRSDHNALVADISL